jgi:diguanylate cyclase (GGDEF)-like protein
MLDVDHFKNFNDTHGHVAGDRVLQEVGKLLFSSIRGSDVACRYGGEEFLLILPRADASVTRQRAEAIRRYCEKDLVVEHGDDRYRITMSAGVAVYPDHGNDAKQVVKAVDQALYEAKRGGRNKVVSA